MRSSSGTDERRAPVHADAGRRAVRSGLLAAAPLLLAYLLPPLRHAAQHLSWSGLLPDWLAPDWPWLALAGAGLAASPLLLGRSGPARGARVSAPLAVVFLAVGVLMAVSAFHVVSPRLQGPFFPEERFWLLTLPEAAPLILGLLAGLWAASFGAPGVRSFRVLGGVLAGLALADVAVTSVLAGFPVPGGALLGRGEHETRAFLLALALLLGVDDESRAGLAPTTGTLLLMGGLLVSGSPVALLAAGAGFLFLGRERLETRIGFALACAGGVAAPVFGGAPAAADGRMHLYMTWLAGVESFNADPWSLLKGFGPWPLDFRLPEEAAAVLGLPDMSFTLSPSAIPAFWLRLALVWGALPGVVLLLTSLALTAVTTGRVMAAIMALALVQGVVFPLLYDPAAAVAFCLAVACVLSNDARQRREADVAGVSGPDGPADTP